MKMKYILSDNRLFYIALSLSLGLHILFISIFSRSNTTLLKKDLKRIEVTYKIVKPKTVQQKKIIEIKKLKLVDNKPKVKDLDILDKGIGLSSTLGDKIRDISKLPEKLHLSKKAVPKMPQLEGAQRKISIPEFRSEKITNPQYLSYNESVRQKIRARAYSYIDHPDFKQGNVYLTFILTKDGRLKDIKTIEEKTQANAYLRQIGIRSIKESQPFHPFPENLGYPELTFNVVMSFELTE